MTSSAMRPASRPTRVYATVISRRTCARLWRLRSWSWRDRPWGRIVSVAGLGLSRRFRRLLPPCDLRPNQEARGAIRRNTDDLTAAKAAISPSSLIVVIGVGKAVLFPSEKTESVANCSDKHGRFSEPGQVSVSSEILHELLDGDMIAASQWNTIEFPAQACPGKGRHEPLIIPQFLACPHSQRVLTG
jgi:hypothetical protein